MSNENSNFSHEEVVRMLFESEEERKLAQQEDQFRYQERKNQKEAHRQKVEAAALKICDMIAAAPELQKPEEIAALASALSQAAIAMHAAENYAEYRPITGFGLGCAV